MARILFFLLTVVIHTSGQSAKLRDRAADALMPYGKEYRQAGFYVGDTALDHYIKTSLKYPEPARDSNIQGRVMVRFIVDEQGQVSKAAVIKGVGFGCDEEALSVIKAMPLWKPATYKGKPTSSAQILPCV